MTRNDRTIHVLLAAIAFLLGANLLINLHQDRAAVAAGLPDSGAQLQQQVDQLIDLNKKVDKLQGFLESGKLAVTAKEMPKAAN
jgi:predicted component of type VI protein secretion system